MNAKADTGKEIHCLLSWDKVSRQVLSVFRLSFSFFHPRHACGAAIHGPEVSCTAPVEVKFSFSAS